MSQGTQRTHKPLRQVALLLQTHIIAAQSSSDSLSGCPRRCVWRRLLVEIEGFESLLISNPKPIASKVSKAFCFVWF